MNNVVPICPKIHIIQGPLELPIQIHGRASHKIKVEYAAHVFLNFIGAQPAETVHKRNQHGKGKIFVFFLFSLKLFKQIVGYRFE